ncbi:FAD/NAD(P)-binding protein [Levilactobacillus bambusae]|uniref:FAD-dependent urate hydroxylase HpyO/Asp monooxygenase CreE-like FAD/NAD(P)-binding domain-containing protein n=1 Tax=Levilactobacillus bambusae TaxID=2024736 RepID=A0A2V1N0C8_9LACO|nr:FAD/NAD(P)-binding protein [Levilactobacillus bambusae]PWF99825.1 hypothetical protein DCM90_07125 [Levilactobacillus bambusae]
MQITIIGAGPRGLLVLERLLTWHSPHSTESLEITLMDDFPVGGHVWRTDQNPLLLMNTVAQEISLFADSSVEMRGQSVTGPDLCDWAQSQVGQRYIATHDLPNRETLQTFARHLGKNDYAPRALFGVYLQWFYEQQLNRQSDTVTIQFIQESVVEIRHVDTHDIIKTAHRSLLADQIIMALGHSENRPTTEQRSFADFAESHGLAYFPPMHPGDADFSKLTDGQTVIMRGLGLSFFDYITLLTLGRGGKYQQTDHELTYQPSGYEPQIIAGSRRGFPYYPKGVNQKKPGEEWQSHFLTAEALTARHISRPMDFTAFQHLVRLDVELVYYQLLIKQKYPKLSADQFKQDYLAAADPETVIDQAPFNPEDRWNWESIIQPLRDEPAGVNHQQFILERLNTLIVDAKLGNLTGPINGALDALRDFRSDIRFIVENHWLTNDAYINDFLTTFDQLNSFLVVGPPLVRIEQLCALMRAGIVTLADPNMTVTIADNHFQTQVGGQPVSAAALIESRLPRIDLMVSHNPLLASLISHHTATPELLATTTNPKAQTHAVLVDHETDRLIDAYGHSLSNFYFWGIPTEGEHWMTTTAPRPDVNDSNFITADRIASEILAPENQEKDLDELV